VFVTWICDVPPKTPGATFVNVIGAAHDGLLFTPAGALIVRQAVPAFTVLLIVSVPELTDPPAFVVSALNDAQVPLPAKRATAPAAIMRTRVVLSLSIALAAACEDSAGYWSICQRRSNVILSFWSAFGSEDGAFIWIRK